MFPIMCGGLKAHKSKSHQSGRSQWLRQGRNNFHPNYYEPEFRERSGKPEDIDGVGMYRFKLKRNKTA